MAGRDMTGSMPAGLVIAELRPEHWPEVERIYAAGIATGNATFETATPSWPEFDAHHLPVARIVGLLDERLVGWGALSPVSRREVYAGVAEVSVYVDLNLRGRGIGRALLAALVQASEAAGIWTLQASIFVENGASLWIHEEAGFRVVGRRERIARREGEWRDTVLLERRSRVAGQ